MSDKIPVFSSLVDEYIENRFEHLENDSWIAYCDNEDKRRREDIRYSTVRELKNDIELWLELNTKMVWHKRR